MSWWMENWSVSSELEDGASRMGAGPLEDGEKWEARKQGRKRKMITEAWGSFSDIYELWKVSIYLLFDMSTSLFHPTYFIRIVPTEPTFPIMMLLDCNVSNNMIIIHSFSTCMSLQQIIFSVKLISRLIFLSVWSSW